PTSLLARRLAIPPPHSFPTRRSSDLGVRGLRGLVIRLLLDGGDAGREPLSRGATLRASVLFDQVGLDRRCQFPSRFRSWFGYFGDRKSTRLNSSHEWISYAVFCLNNK